MTLNDLARKNWPMTNRLTKAELEAVIGVAGDALAAETLSSDPDQTEDELEAAIDAFESGMEKLRRQLSAKSREKS